MARRSFLATGASGHTPSPLRTFRTSKPSSTILCSPVSTERAATWTQPATLAVGAIRSERRPGSSRHRSATWAATASVGRRPPLEHEDGAIGGGLVVADLLEQLALHPGHRPGRPRAHGEVALRIDRPAGVLGGQACRHRMVRRDLNGREADAGQLHRGEGHGGETAQADLGQAPAGLEAALHADPAVEHASAVRQPRGADPEQAGVRLHGVGEGRRAPVQAGVHTRTSYHGST